jgi:hypothetical protein
VSRNYGGIRDRAAENKRIREARERPPPIAIAYRCAPGRIAPSSAD